MAVELVAGEKMKGESNKAVIACNDYLRMGPGRSLQKLHRMYSESASDKPTTGNLRVLAGWSSKYGWVERAEAYDREIEAEKTAAEKANQLAIAARRKEIMQSGVALDFERVERLKRLADFLEAQVFYEPPSEEVAAERLRAMVEIALSDEDDRNEVVRAVLAQLDPSDPKAKYPNVWARDVKAIAGGKTVDIVRFNSALLAELRSTFADIAAETGGRRQRTITENIDYSKLTEEQLQRVAAGEDPIQVILSDYVPGHQG